LDWGIGIRIQSLVGRAHSFRKKTLGVDKRRIPGCTLKEDSENKRKPSSIRKNSEGINWGGGSRNEGRKKEHGRLTAPAGERTTEGEILY